MPCEQSRSLRCCMRSHLSCIVEGCRAAPKGGDGAPAVPQKVPPAEAAVDGSQIVPHRVVAILHIHHYHLTVTQQSCQALTVKAMFMYSFHGRLVLLGKPCPALTCHAALIHPRPSNPASLPGHISYHRACALGDQKGFLVSKVENSPDAENNSSTSRLARAAKLRLSVVDTEECVSW